MGSSSGRGGMLAKGGLRNQMGEWQVPHLEADPTRCRRTRTLGPGTHQVVFSAKFDSSMSVWFYTTS